MLAFYGLGLPRQPYDPADPTTVSTRPPPIRTPAPKSPVLTTSQPMPSMYTCADGTQVTDPSLCSHAAMYACPDGSQVVDPSLCPAPQAQASPPIMYTCYDGSQATDPTLCPLLTQGQIPVPADGSSQGMQVTPTQSPDDTIMPPDMVPTICGVPQNTFLLIGGAIVAAFGLGALLLRRQ